MIEITEINIAKNYKMESINGYQAGALICKLNKAIGALEEIQRFERLKNIDIESLNGLAGKNISDFAERCKNQIETYQQRIERENSRYQKIMAELKPLK